ncbi:MAG: hypothetical protein M1814_006375 [Vezdaea aestivalis]|nr:MAG: hypothetical protein M1814_006375 [Vezdaea aestivalis]
MLAARQLPISPANASRLFTKQTRLFSIDQCKADLTALKFPNIICRPSRHPSEHLCLTLQDAFPFAVDYLALRQHKRRLPFTHHLLHFHKVLPISHLLADGSDPDYWPGEPFVRRLWAGGSVRESRPGIQMVGPGLVLCTERITDVTMRGPPGDEKVFVHIERLIGRHFTMANNDRINPNVRRYRFTRIPSLSEDRILAFVRAPTGQTVASRKAIKAKHSPDYSTTLFLTKEHLFRYSALTLNDHKIHLSKSFCEAEGHPDLLVHGPLLLNIMAIALHAAGKKYGFRGLITEIDYRNLAPICVNTEFKVCVRVPDAVKQNRYVQESPNDEWTVWIEGPEGNMAVRATAKEEQEPIASKYMLRSQLSVPRNHLSDRLPRYI